LASQVLTVPTRCQRPAQSLYSSQSSCYE